MTPVAPQEIVSAHSPDSDDAFMFYALGDQEGALDRVTFRHVLSDIETLNRKAMEGCTISAPFPITRIPTWPINMS